MALSFDPANRRIVLDSAATSAAELWSRWSDWAATGDNLKHLPAFRQVGGDDLGGGLSIPPYLFLLNGWRVRPMEASHQLVVTGNLFVEGGGSPVVNTLGAFNVATQLTVPVQAQAVSTSGSAGPSAADIAAAVGSRVIEGGLTEDALLRVLLAALAGRADGIGTTTERYLGRDGATPRITATFDTAGNRTSVVVDGA